MPFDASKVDRYGFHGEYVMTYSFCACAAALAESRAENEKIHKALGAIDSETALEKATQLLKRKMELYEGMCEEEDRANKLEAENEKLRGIVREYCADHSKCVQRLKRPDGIMFDGRCSICKKADEALGK